MNSQVKYVKIDGNNYIFSLRAHVSDEALIPYPVLHTPSHFPAPLFVHPLVLRQFGSHALKHKVIK